MPPRNMFKQAMSSSRDISKVRGSLQDVENIGYERDYSAKMHKMDMESLQGTIADTTEGIQLLSNVYGGFQSKKEFGEAKTEVQTGMAKTAYGKSDVGKAEGATPWAELGEEGQSEWMGKFTPTEKPQEWHEKLFGADKQWRFGGEDPKPGKKDLSTYYSKSTILAEGLSSSSTSLSQITGSYKPPFALNLDKEVGGIGEDKTKVNDTGGFTGPPKPEGIESLKRSEEYLRAGYELPPTLGGSPIEEDETMGQANRRFLEGGGQAGGAFDWRGKQYKSWQ